ncbi:CRISPR-associated CARF protein Csx1 [Acidiplasma aeolicum]|jgi:CRISPR-associated protein Csx1|uniref:CRISPR-associated CARF protein Csx1 n=1 Tax=Acidiplasma aeolicum TaxID=507754 RepID=UPI003722D401
MHNFLLALWGNPLKWENANYSINDKMYNSITSSSIIFKGENVENSCIFIPDSVFPEMLYNNAFLNDINDNIKCKLIELFNEKDSGSADFIKLSKINLFPSPGTYYNNKEAYEYNVNIDYLYTYFYSAVIRLLSTDDDVDTILIDTTHGVNFLQFIFIDSIKYACNTYSLNHKRKIVIKYYNSDPYYKNNAVLNINNIKIEVIDSKNILSIISRDFLNKYKYYKNTIKKYFNNKNGLERYIKACSIMVQSDTIPYLLYIIDNKHECLKIDNNYYVNISIKEENCRKILCHEFSDNIKINIETIAFMDSLNAIYNAMKSHIKYEIKDIYAIADIFFGRDSDIIFIKKELSDRNKIKLHNTDLSNFKRNFKAHAGLLDYMYDINNNFIEFKTANINGIKINMEYVINKIIE